MISATPYIGYLTAKPTTILIACSVGADLIIRISLAVHHYLHQRKTADDPTTVRLLEAPKNLQKLYRIIDFSARVLPASYVALRAINEAMSLCSFWKGLPCGIIAGLIIDDLLIASLPRFESAPAKGVCASIWHKAITIPVDAMCHYLTPTDEPIFGGVPAVLLHAPFVEEKLFRGLLQPALIKYMGIPTGIFITACAFSSIHWKGNNPYRHYHTVSHIANGLLLGIAAHYFSLPTAIGMHMGMNLPPVITEIILH